ncbi:hypothetical protein OCA5_c29380 [Afipia carboxidovorans OM5]|uniref:Cytochrome c n=1 Tax=Afipia carboxidovorans (strain ATCC 49405 / DSM 1227 / KCTC 32145 / OM5) TaxID=504832 RepID=F8BXV0_AFIC5|nr:hypothetical protein [Afipia carboxidovorans]AEI07629.1 hypothetical protein OCA5_c29380 [Afipia carboxidovorans OM5]
MRVPRTIAGLTVVLFAAILAPGATKGSSTNILSREAYFPHLGDLMSTMQTRHLKLWFAGRSNNWPLASYEVDLMMENFRDIALLYPNVPVADVEMLIEPTKDISAAIEAKDAGKFSQAYAALTAACNACHQAIGREYIVMQVPTASPFSNQVFPPQK